MPDTVMAAFTSASPARNYSIGHWALGIAQQAQGSAASFADMTVTETVKETLGLRGGPSAPASREAMSEAKLPLPYRDNCAHLLIPLNRCRFEEYYLPWKCETERHTYEKCQYEDFKKRVAKMDELREAKGGARSN